MSSGFDAPVRNSEVNSITSPPLEAHHFLASATPRAGSPEPDVLEFGSPFRNNQQTASDQTSVAQGIAPGQQAPVGDQQRIGEQKWDPQRPGWDQLQKFDNKRAPGEKQPPSGELRIGNQPPQTSWEDLKQMWDKTPSPSEQQPREQNGPGYKRPPWDSSRPGWDQLPSDRQKQTDNGDAPRRDRQPGEIRTGSDQYRLSDRVGAREMRQIPDAKVFVNPGFDPSKPINLIVYNHGWNDTVDSAFRNEKLQEQMAQAPPNSMLVIPSWQARDGAASGAEDPRFKNNFVGMLDAAVRTSGGTLNNVSRISFVSHSAGYNAIDRELNALSRTALYDRVSTVANLDTNYEARQPAVDAWIAHNIRNGNFANGNAAFLNLWTSDTDSLSRAQAQRIANLVEQSGGPQSKNLMGIDAGRRRGAITARELSNMPIVFQNTGDAHANLPGKFFGHSIAKLRK